MSREKNFLKVISQLESSGGKNTKHRKMQTGLHKGDTAIGEYGLMPNTVKEIARRVDKNDLDDVLANVPSHAVKEILKANPHKEEEYAEVLSKKVLDTAGGDVEKAAAGWLYGHNMSKDGMKQKLNSDPQYKSRINAVLKNQGMRSEPESFVESLQQPPEDVLFSKIKDRFKPPANAPQLKPATGKEQPVPEYLDKNKMIPNVPIDGGRPLSYKDVQEMNDAMAGAEGFSGGGMAAMGSLSKKVPKLAKSVAEGLKREADTGFGKTIVVDTPTINQLDALHKNKELSELSREMGMLPNEVKQILEADENVTAKLQPLINEYERLRAVPLSEMPNRNEVMQQILEQAKPLHQARKAIDQLKTTKMVKRQMGGDVVERAAEPTLAITNTSKELAKNILDAEKQIQKLIKSGELDQAKRDKLKELYRQLDLDRAEYNKQVKGK